MTFLMLLLTVAVVFVTWVACTFMAAAPESAENKIRGTLLAAFLVLAGSWGWFYTWKNSPQREVEAAAKDCGNTTMAFVMSQNYVKQRLKSPSSAEFPYVIDRGVQVVPDGKCGFYISAYVDSQNGFGAMIRSSYQANISYDRKSKLWRLGDLSIQ